MLGPHLQGQPRLRLRRRPGLGRDRARQIPARQIPRALDFTETITAIREHDRLGQPHLPGPPGHAILIEKAANGAAVIDMLRRELTGIIPVIPKGDKVSRASAIAPQIEAGTSTSPAHPTPPTAARPQPHP